MKQSSIAAVVLCAGKGTRMRSKRAKVLHPILGKPLCYYPLARAHEVGASPVVAVVGHQAGEVEAAVKPCFPEGGLRFVLQREQKGTADAVRSAQGALQGFDGVVLILYGDTPLLEGELLTRLLAAYTSGKGPLALVTTTAPNPKGYGRIVREAGSIRRVVEDKDCSEAQREITEVNAGMYAVRSSFLWEALGKVKGQNAQGELYLTDLVELATKEGEVQAVSVDFEKTAGVNDKAELAACAKVLQARINLAHQRAGVTLLDPATTFIDEGVEIGPDTELGPFVSLQGKTKVGEGVAIGQGSVLTDSVVSEGTVVKPYSVFESAVVGKACQIGPFARLRPGTELAEGVHLGNFVETKKATLGKGTKANHLSYLGDAKIGAGVNVGAGTITCNYDGKNKLTTVLEDGVFVGSDTQLVAPVTVGAGSYIGAGTTVTRDVPPESLVVSRVPQVNKEGWVREKRQKGGQ
jgi:bifunctional UDP-N-acetylglucosamine pyrophosphorylase/glucosamine-1-phosphate N-acetyltransferase